MKSIKEFFVGLVEKALDKNKVYQKQQDWLTETNIELQNLKDENERLREGRDYLDKAHIAAMATLAKVREYLIESIGMPVDDVDKIVNPASINLVDTETETEIPK
ncbi:MAG: hypothetical protein ACYS30_23250 [Planctomycetota bacterium]|jgi:hypothetical protein